MPVNCGACCAKRQASQPVQQVSPARNKSDLTRIVGLQDVFGANLPQRTGQRKASSIPISRRGRLALVVAGLLALSAAASGEQARVVSARAGQRNALAFPALGLQRLFGVHELNHALAELLFQIRVPRLQILELSLAVGQVHDQRDEPVDAAGENDTPEAAETLEVLDLQKDCAWSAGAVPRRTRRARTSRVNWPE